MDIINGLLNDDILRTLIAVTALTTLADFIVGVSAALAKGTFKVEHLLDFLQTHIAGRVFPILAVAVIGHFYEALFAIAAAASAAYVIETLASIRDSLGAPAEG